MKSIQNLNKHSLNLPLLADDVVEFHAARLILLLKLCGVKGRINGLTKMAKLDFFVRYPKFFVTACEALGEPPLIPSSATTESKMVRYHYGPWDQRYYQILAYLESRGLLFVEKKNKTFVFSLTNLGKETADKLRLEAPFTDLCKQMQSVKKVLGGKSGSQLKNLIYELFEQEVTELPLERVIG